MFSIPSLFTPSSPFPSKTSSSDDVGALGGTTEAAGGTNDDVAGGGGEDSTGWWWCRVLTAAPMFPDGEFFYVMNSEIGCVFLKSLMFPQDSSSSAANLGKPGDVPLIRCTECHKWQVVRRISKQPWSDGEVFYYCPAHKVRFKLF